ncbi:hypothetical protein SAMN06296020_1121 [Anoxynatronum buryatiense]|uniref:Uncharacterized protein n=1 Tax=Anoxynatronum buryatiense TaxID=489973 RepID=A0AA45WXL2_9CLOT|nr:hypothetical protein SAMN06296020_1121 [Anoxynatronum buryatiense]
MIPFVSSPLSFHYIFDIGKSQFNMSYFHSNITCFSFQVSIHAPARGATLLLHEGAVGYACFNPRSRTGSDSTLFTNTHALLTFQSTLPHGERPLLLPLLPTIWEFQSTLPHGERLGGCHSWKPCWMFQSTLPHGERPWGFSCSTPPPGFQSTLPHGERQEAQSSTYFHLSFQSTLPHGERLI